MADALILTRRRRRRTRRELLGLLVTRLGLLALVLAWAAAVAFLASHGQPQAAVGLTAAVPVVALVVHNPFNAVLIWALVMPFFVQSPTAETGMVPWALHRLMPPVALALVVVHDALGIRRSSFKFSWMDVALLVFIGIAAVNILYTAANTQRELVSFYDKVGVPFVFFWLVRAVHPTRNDLTRLVVIGIATIAIQVVLGIMSWVAPGMLPSQWLGRAGERTVGSFGGPAPYTITLVLYALLALHDAWYGSAPVRRIAAFAAVAGALLAVFLSQSRGSWLGAAAAFGGLVVLRPRAVAVIGIASLVVAGALALGPLNDQVGLAQQRIEDEATVASRLITNEASVRMIEARPLTGFGFGNFERFDESFKRRVTDIPLKLGGSSHNTYLNLVVELGIPAAVLYFVPPVVLLARTVRWRHRLRAADAAAGALVVMLWLALLDQFLVSNFLEMVHAYPWGTSLWWITLGLIATTLQRARTEDPPGQRRRWALR